MSFIKCWTYFELTLASVVLPKFSGLSPVEIMQDDRERDILICKWLKGTPPLLSGGWGNNEAMPLFRDFPSNLMKQLSSQWNPNIAVMPNSAVLIWASFVCCCHGSLSMGVWVYLTTRVTHWSIRWQAAVIKRKFLWTAQLLVDPIMAPAFILLWNGLLNTSYKISTQLPKVISAAI